MDFQARRKAKKKEKTNEKECSTTSAPPKMTPAKEKPLEASVTVWLQARNHQNLTISLDRKK
jgi:hypothetical protein